MALVPGSGSVWQKPFAASLLHGGLQQSRARGWLAWGCKGLAPASRYSWNAAPALAFQELGCGLHCGCTVTLHCPSTSSPFLPCHLRHVLPSEPPDKAPMNLCFFPRGPHLHQEHCSTEFPSIPCTFTPLPSPLSLQHKFFGFSELQLNVVRKHRKHF